MIKTILVTLYSVYVIQTFVILNKYYDVAHKNFILFLKTNYLISLHKC